MEELLSLKWNNHKNSFLQLLSTLRKKNNYTDVTLACDGQLYNVHKMVLSACSDYFSNIFDSISCPNPVIVLKDMTASNLESLLDYMYLGEVSVRQSDLASLIQSAECLKLRGLAVPDNDSGTEQDNRKRTADSSSPRARKKSRRSTIKEVPTFKSNSPTARETIFVETLSDKQSSTSNSPSLKTEDFKEDLVTIKEEADEEVSNTWDFSPSIGLDFDSTNFDPNQQEVDDGSEYDTVQPSFVSDSFNDGDDSSNISSNFNNQPPLPSTSLQHGKISHPNLPEFEKFRCTFCSKEFRSTNHLHRHVRIHTGEKPFGCRHCPYKSTQKETVVNHMAAKHRDFSKNVINTLKKN